MRRLIRKAACRDEQEQTTPSAPSASATRETTTGESIGEPLPIPFSYDAPSLLPGLDAAPNPILFVRHPALTIFYANPIAEAAPAVSHRQLVETSLYELFADPSELVEMIAAVAARQFDTKWRDVLLDRLGYEPLHAHTVVGVLDFAPASVLLELLPNEQKIHNECEERLLDLTSINKKLIRNLAHEIKSPLGGIRSAAQLLEFELSEHSLREYTQVIIKESDRLQTLVGRLLESHRHPCIVGDVSIHEALECVRLVMLAEFPQGLHIVRDYDASLPGFRGDKEQLIQAMSSIVHNVAHALGARIAQGDSEIILRTRVTRKITITKRLYKLALNLHVVDNGPSIPDDIREQIFFPLVSGREGGGGLGLALAQTSVRQHDGLIRCGSRPGQTDFRILIPLY